MIENLPKATAMRRAGATYQEIAAACGLSRQRWHMLLRHIPTPPKPSDTPKLNKAIKMRENRATYAEIVQALGRNEVYWRRQIRRFHGVKPKKRPPKTPLTQEIIDDYLAGLSVERMAVKYGNSPCYWQRRLNEKWIKRQSADVPPSAEQIADAVEMYRHGAAVTDIVAKHGSCHQRWRKLLVQHGVTIRPRGRPIEKAKQKKGRRRIEPALPEIVAEYEAGTSSIRLAKKYGHTPTYWLKRLTAAGVKIRSRQRHETSGYNKALADVLAALDGIDKTDGAAIAEKIEALRKTKGQP